MGTWRRDQSKGARRVIWGQTRGKNDETWKEFEQRLGAFPELAKLRIEKIGAEIHCWRQVESPSKEIYWTSCLRFVDEGYGYWSLWYRTDERRWRSTPNKELPAGRTINGAAEWYRDHFGATSR